MSLPEEELDTVSIPNAKPERAIYALKVEGNSMEHEKIFHGDYVIVKEFSASEWPKDGEIEFISI